jgi:hypothetical protein
MKKFFLAAVAAAVLMPAMASARVVVGFGPVYRPFGMYRYGYWGGPYWGYPGVYGGGVYRQPTTGAVKFDTHDKSAAVYVNEAYAGTVDQVKTLHLKPGSYQIAVTEPGRVPFSEKVYVTAGATVKLQPRLAPLDAPPPPAGYESRP